MEIRELSSNGGPECSSLFRLIFLDCIYLGSKLLLLLVRSTPSFPLRNAKPLGANRLENCWSYSVVEASLSLLGGGTEQGA